MQTTSSVSPQPSQQSAQPTPPKSQREMVIASLLRGHGTTVKRPGPA